jgi:hypothetical protein
MSQAVTADQVDELLRFLPQLGNPDREFVAAGRGGERNPDGSVTVPFPSYLPEVQEFFRLAAQPWWQDHGYVPAAAAAMIQDDDLIRTATIDQVRTMLTLCVRGERFCDGYWEGVLKTGRITALLNRLAALRSQM